MRLSAGRRAGAVAVLAVSLLALGGCTDDDAAGHDGGGDGATTTVSTTSTTVPLDFSGVDAATEEFVADEGLNGAAVIVVDRDRGIVHEQYLGEFGPDRVSLIASSSKMLTAGVLMRLDDQGLLDVDGPVENAVSWGSGNPDVTPAQLVSNSSGLVGLVNDPTFPPYLCQYLAAGTLQDCAERIFTTTEDDDQVIDPDTQFRYGGAQWQVAGAVAEAVSNKSWSELIEETYVEPCGVDSLGYSNHFAQRDVIGDASPFSYPANFGGDVSKLPTTDNPNMEGGAYITPPDYAALLLMHLRGGRCGDTQVLSEAAVDRMHADRIGPAYDGSTPSEDLAGYGLGWWVDRAPGGRVEDAGAFGAVPWLDLEDGYGVYVVVERTSEVGKRLATTLRPLIDEQMQRRG